MIKYAMEERVQKALDKIVDSIDKKRKAELDWLYEDQGVVQKWMDAKRKENWNNKPVGKAGWRHTACVPMAVHRIFQKMYGPNYLDDMDFFEKIAPEWKLVKNSKNR